MFQANALCYNLNYYCNQIDYYCYIAYIKLSFYTKVKKDMKKKYRILSAIPALIIMCIIFYFSHQEAAESSKLSGGIIENIFSLNEKIFSLELPIEERIHWLELLETLIRKAAHMTEYGVLAIALSYWFYVYDKRGISLILWSEVIAVLYAATDEFHQLFIPGRSGQVTDVLIDGTGAFLGCLLFYIISKKFRKDSDYH